FFSSRRRHTISKRDWSSDVCSSDLYVYFMLNKPNGYLSATEDRVDPVVVDLIEGYEHYDLFPVGRLDKDTEGLLIITNDGLINHKLTSPNYEVPKTYFA